MKAIVVYESLTGNTRKTAGLVAQLLADNGISSSVSPINSINLQNLSEADLVVIGSWTDGLFITGQKPARAGRLAAMPRIDGKKAAVFCTYAIDPGKTLPKMEKIVADRGGQIIGGYAIKRNNLAGGASEFVDRLVGLTVSA